MIKNNRALGLLSAAAVACVLVVGPSAAATAAQASPVSARVKIVKYANCTALNKVHRGGVAKAGVKYNKVSGVNRAFRTKPTFNTALYTANVKLDRDKDGVACEKG